MERTKIGKVAGVDDTYIFLTLKGSQPHGMSKRMMEAEMRAELQKRSFSETEIDAIIAHADANPI